MSSGLKKLDRQPSTWMAPPSSPPAPTSSSSGLEKAGLGNGPAWTLGELSWSLNRLKAPSLGSHSGRFAALPSEPLPSSASISQPARASMLLSSGSSSASTASAQTAPSCPVASSPIKGVAGPPTSSPIAAILSLSAVSRRESPLQCADSGPAPSSLGLAPSASWPPPASACCAGVSTSSNSASRLLSIERRRSCFSRFFASFSSRFDSFGLLPGARFDAECTLRAGLGLLRVCVASSALLQGTWRLRSRKGSLLDDT
mmetsp:Transcript_30404/g.75991  ORF Transcript_30404/g.75991 Transcript_30404/m.75991 type:complete len:258 (-) Transcript_30404:33-806(-)